MDLPCREDARTFETPDRQASLIKERDQQPFYFLSLLFSFFSSFVRSSSTASNQINYSEVLPVITSVITRHPADGSVRRFGCGS
jgi:hypothetical protein